MAHLQRQSMPPYQTVEVHEATHITADYLARPTREHHVEFLHADSRANRAMRRRKRAAKSAALLLFSKIYQIKVSNARNEVTLECPELQDAPMARGVKGRLTSRF